MIKSPESQIYALVVAVQFLLDHKAIEPAFELSTQMLAYCQEQTDSGRRWVHSRLLAPALHLPYVLQCTYTLREATPAPAPLGLIPAVGRCRDCGATMVGCGVCRVRLRVRALR